MKTQLVTKVKGDGHWSADVAAGRVIQMPANLHASTGSWYGHATRVHVAHFLAASMQVP